MQAIIMPSNRLLLCGAFVMSALVETNLAFIVPPPSCTRCVKKTAKPQHHPLHFAREPPDDNGEQVKVGTKKYYEGFLASDLKSEPRERVTGDAILGPTFKFVGGFSVVILVLFLGFMASNGLI